MLTDEIVFCRAVPSDLDAVCRIERASFKAPWSRRLFKRELSGKIPHSKTIAARIGGRLAAFSVVWTVADETHIINFAVHPEMRRRGVGKALVKRIFEEAVRDDAPRVTLEARVSNEPAIRLYEAMGFHIASIRRNYYQDNGEDAYIMWADARNPQSRGAMP